MGYAIKVELYYLSFNLLWVLSQAVLFWAAWLLCRDMSKGKLGFKDALSWLALVAWVNTIYLTLGTVRGVTNALSERLGEAGFKAMLLALLAVIGALIFGGLIVGLLRRRFGPARIAILLLWFAAAAAVLYYLGEIPIERIHLAEYGLVGALSWRSLRPLLSGRALILAAILLAAALGALDEVTQFFVPNRVFDYRDVAVNLAAGTVGIGIIKTLLP